MTKFNDEERKYITDIQYRKDLSINNLVEYENNGKIFSYGVTLEIHNNGTSHYAHKPAETYEGASGEQLYAVQIDKDEQGPPYTQHIPHT